MEQILMPYSLTGQVIHGRGKGHTVGMPTVNLGVERGAALPPLGVYASLVYVDERVFMGVTNVGTRPSVDNEPDVTVETLILDFNEDIYGREVTVEFHQFLRPVKKMESLKAVQQQVAQDSLKVRDYFKQGYRCSDHRTF